MWKEIAIAISNHTKKEFMLKNSRSVGGGCINQAYQLIGENNSYFVKLNSPHQWEMFRVEAIALRQMYDTNTIRVPKPICTGYTDNHSYIVLEWLEFGRANNQSWQTMGKHLAQLHQQGKADKFGWDYNNTIGSTPQINDWVENWADFFAEKRIGYQLKLASRKGATFGNQNNIIEAIKIKLSHHHPQPSLVHGDLWGGNASFLAGGIPIIFDPATYYGDREVDIAMTELFGGFPSAFYEGYNQEWPLDSGYAQRKTIYNLYHILNHYNLFGGGYASQAQGMINQIL
ncbi:Ribulosamine/erythrulosamine 3-kinase potentially involved in protein deglycation [Cyanobacterium sp. HL-69]|uniref:fructosamine kinase family protein n=1 Tax=Cyanobacterium sp. HL-69 TaxID=2054282 RepID=UPI000CA28AA6|nr:Ribulosamine/erythrulosamine 3-kinase potentially involved in protein deglycation [Cyanobacterium sp. HL-69]